MRYKQDQFLKESFKELLSLLLADYPEIKTDVDQVMHDTITGYLELGFDAGCNSCAVYSKELKELYNSVDTD